MDIIKSGARPTRYAPEKNFTGVVIQDPIFEAPAPARSRATLVTFLPGAHTNWHTHPLGQILYIVFGTGRVQTEGGPIREVHAGDVVWFPPNERHWHGAGPTTQMAHIGMAEPLNGSSATWMEPVTDAQFNGTPE